mmetsp:Transcript_26870/g.40667  ORF Transcript_26870/g.40667 Transcript_26870/m.40667 type:complete len:86 (-) Transcript_26870:1029-1286(-)
MDNPAKHAIPSGNEGVGVGSGVEGALSLSSLNSGARSMRHKSLNNSSFHDHMQMYITPLLFPSLQRIQVPTVIRLDEVVTLSKNP